jgi:RNA ligase
MHIHDLINEELLLDEIAGGFIRVQTHADYGFRIYNYSEKAMFEKRWNDATEQCRGLITDVDGTVLARPWRKFFNYGERGLLISSNDPVEITDKLDGSLGIAYPVGGERWAVATRGSFASDQAVFATQWLTRHSRMWVPQREFTALFEIIYPENRIVLDYGHFKGLVLLGAVDIVHGNVYGPREAVGIFDWAGESAAVFPETTIAEYMSGPNAHRSNAEGVVVRAGRKMLKIKQEDYVRAHAVVTGLSNKAVWQMLANGNSVPEQAAFMPDEFYSWLITTAEELTAAMIDWKTEALVEWHRIGNNLLHMYNGAHTRKDFAALASKSQYSAALFRLYDNRDIDDLAWKAVRPVRFERPFNRSEDEA